MEVTLFSVIEKLRDLKDEALLRVGAEQDRAARLERGTLEYDRHHLRAARALGSVEALHFAITGFEHMLKQEDAFQAVSAS